jgi:hypothetical protein
MLMPKEPIRAPLGVNVPGLTMAGFQLTLHGRIWVIPEAGSYPYLYVYMHVYAKLCGVSGRASRRTSESVFAVEATC